VTRRVDAARSALDKYTTTGHIDIVPAYRPGDDTAAMFVELDYYGAASRGGVATWKNEMATLSWTYWLLFDGLSHSSQVTIPTLFVHSDDCVLPENIRLVHDRVRGPKRLAWGDGAQTDFYDQPSQVDFAVNAADAFLKGNE
jgi:hypothetical protein